MRIAQFAAVITTAFALSSPALAQPQPAPVRVMIVGTFHLSNPGHDLHNVQVEDVLQPRPQAQIAEAVAGLAAFHPTAVMTEWPAAQTRSQYAQFLAGTLPPSRNEVVQFGFRLAKAADLKQVYGIDVDGDFPFEAVEAYAKAHGQAALLDRVGSDAETEVRAQTEMLRSEGIAATLRFVNDPSHIARGNDFYREMLRVGGGSEQPGAELLTAWYRRNFLICSNLIQNTRPGDRVVVFYGAGHAFLLRQCIAETPGLELVEPNPFLPK